MNPFEAHYALVISQEIIWGDMDAYEHINNTVYFRYFEDVRLAYFEKIGVNQYKEEYNIGPILARTECDFRRPLKYPDRIQIAARSEILSEKKFNMSYAIYSEQHQAVVAEGQGLIVFYDYSAGRSCKIPRELVSKMEALQAVVQA